jgi:hypothetical protein
MSAMEAAIPSSTTLSSEEEKDSSRTLTPGPHQNLQQVTALSSNVMFKEKPMSWDDTRNTLNPFNWSVAKKWRVTILASFMTFVIQLNGTMLTSAAGQINESFDISDEKFPHSYWPVLSWNLGGAAAPLFGLPLMENFGVRKSYIVCDLVRINPVSSLYLPREGYPCPFDRFSHSRSCSAEFCDTDSDEDHHWRLLRDIGKYHVRDRKRYLESWTSEKL